MTVWKDQPAAPLTMCSCVSRHRALVSRPPEVDANHRAICGLGAAPSTSH